MKREERSGDRKFPRVRHEDSRRQILPVLGHGRAFPLKPEEDEADDHFEDFVVENDGGGVVSLFLRGDAHSRLTRDERDGGVLDDERDEADGADGGETR